MNFFKKLAYEVVGDLLYIFCDNPFFCNSLRNFYVFNVITIAFKDTDGK